MRPPKFKKVIAVVEMDFQATDVGPFDVEVDPADLHTRIDDLPPIQQMVFAPLIRNYPSR